METENYLAGIKEMQWHLSLINFCILINLAGFNLGVRSLDQSNGGTSIGEGLSGGFRIDHELSETSGIAFDLRNNSFTLIILLTLEEIFTLLHRKDGGVINIMVLEYSLFILRREALEQED